MSFESTGKFVFRVFILNLMDFPEQKPHFVLKICSIEKKKSHLAALIFFFGTIVENQC